MLSKYFASSNILLILAIMKTIQELLSEVSVSKAAKMTDATITRSESMTRYTKKDVEVLYSKYLEIGALQSKQWDVSHMTLRKLFERYNLPLLPNYQQKNRHKPQEFIDDLALMDADQWCKKWDNDKRVYFKLRKRHFPHLIDTRNYHAKNVRPKEYFQDVLTMSSRKWADKWESTRTTHSRIKKKLISGLAISDLCRTFDL